MKLRKITAFILAIVMTAAMLGGCGGQTASAAPSGSAPATATKVVIGTQEMPNSEGIAKSLGYFEEAFGAVGCEVEILSFSSGAKVNTALLSGDIDFGLIGTCPVSNGLSSGIDYQVIFIHEILGTAESLVVKDASGATAADVLRGKTIATPFASTAHYSLIKALENAGLAETDVDMIDMQPAEINAAWQRGDIDAAYVWEPTLSELLTDGTIYLSSKDMADAGYMTADLAVVRTEFAEQNPELVQIYISCLDKAVKLYKEEQAVAESAIADGLEISVEDAAYQMAGYEWLTAEEQYERYFGNGVLADTLFNTANFLLEQASIQAVPPEASFDAAVASDAMKTYLGK